MDEPGRLDGGVALLQPVMRDGHRTVAEPLSTARGRAQRGLAALPHAYRGLQQSPPPPVTYTARLQDTRDAVIADLSGLGAPATPYS
jgi:hypothetical protein